MRRVRLFIAFDTPAGEKARIRGLQEQLKASDADVRWEPPDKLHATLKFLGDTDENLLPAIIAELVGLLSNQTPISVLYRHLGCFPHKHNPRVVWVGIENGDGQLIPLQKRIEQTMERLGFEKEDREFQPHLTLGRVKGKRNLGRLLSLLETLTFESQPVTIREVALVRSDLKPSGSVYTILKSIPLHE